MFADSCTFPNTVWLNLFRKYNNPVNEKILPQQYEREKK